MSLERLGQIQARLSQLHNDRAVIWQAWHQAKYASMMDFLRSGDSITNAREKADASVVSLRNNLVALEGEIASFTEERDHLRFLIEHPAGG